MPSVLNITTADCGTPSFPVSYIGLVSNGEGVTLSAGAPLTGWTALNEYSDVYTTTAPTTTFPQAFIRQIWDSTGKYRLLSRSAVMIASAVGQGGVRTAPGQVTATAAQLQGAEVVVWHNWVSSTNKIAEYNSQTLNISCVGTCGDPFFNAGGNRYALQNVQDPNTLQPGTFFFTPSTRTITYRALPGENPLLTSTVLIAERLPAAIAFSGAEGSPVTATGVYNLTVAHTAAVLEEDGCITSDGCASQSDSDARLAAIVTQFVDGITLSGLELFGTGQDALWFGAGTLNSIADSCWMHDLGMGGARIGLPDSGMEPDPATLATNITVSNCVIERGGLIVQAGVGILAQQARTLNLVHNHIHHLYYTGISTGWTWGYDATPDEGILVGYNLIHDIFMGELSDGGCVYNLGRSPGTTINNNVCHSVVAYNYGGWGLYTDEGSSNVTMVNNIVYNTKSASFHQHYGTDNLITNNIWAFAGVASCDGASNCDNAMIRSSQHPPGSGGGGPNSSFTFTSNILLIGSPNSWAATNYTQVYFTTIPTGLKNMTIDSNMYWTYNGPAPSSLTFGPSQSPMSFTEWQGYGKDVHGVIADPLFVDPGAFDFRLQPGSPAVSQIGFQPIDTSTVGPQTAIVGLLQGRRVRE